MVIQSKRTKIFGLLALLVLVGAFAALGLNSAMADSVSITAPSNVILYPCRDSAEMSVTWWDSAAAASGRVVYGTDENLTDAKTVNATQSATGDSANKYSAFEAKMTGLAAGTKYYYKVGHDNVWSKTNSFTTQPADTTAFKFVFFGDVQSGYDNWAKLVSNAAGNNDLAFALTAGDMVNFDSSIYNWNEFLSAASKNFASLPMLAVTGNHETIGTTGTPDYLQKFMALPTNGPEGFDERFYSYDYGNAHITVLDSNVFSGEENLTEEKLAEIKTWIKNDLAASNATWKIVAMHHPAYAVVSDSIAAKVMANWVDVFEEAQVDVVFCGHQHIYMRTYPMYKEKVNKHGITYVMGNSGDKTYPKADVSYSAKMIENTPTYQLISIDGNKMILKTCTADGTVLDSVNITAHDRTVEIPDIKDVNGDIDGDGNVTADDYDTIIDAILNCTTNVFMDVNGDGKVNIADAHYIKNMLSTTVEN